MEIRKFPLPPVEYMHDKACYAEAVISAVENFRDNPDLSGFEFAVAVQDSGLRDEALEYLTGGLQDCRCTIECPNGAPKWVCLPESEYGPRCDECAGIVGRLTIEDTDEGTIKLELKTFSYAESGDDKSGIQVWDMYGKPYCTLTVNNPGAFMQEGEYLVKTWSENQHIANEILNQGVMVDTGRRIQTGYTEAQVWTLA